MNAPNPNQSEEDPTESITVKDPERFPLIRRAWELMLTGNYSVPMILDKLNNEWGFRTAISKSRKSGGTPLGRASLYKIFVNPRYAGKIPDPITGELLDGKYEPMVTVDEFNHVQYLLGRKGKPRITPKRDFTYKNIATCKECGCNITAEYKYKAKYDKTYVYYHCTHKRGNCRQGSIEEKELTKQFLEFWEDIHIAPEFYEWGLEAVQSMNNVEAKEREAETEIKTKALKEAQKKADRLLDLVVNGTIDEETYKSRVKENKDVITKLQKELNQTISNGNNWREAMIKLLELLAHGNQRFENADLTMKRELLYSLSSNLQIFDKKLVFNTYNWLEPVKKNYKKLEAQFEQVRTSPEQRKNSLIEAIRSCWRRVGDSNSRCRFPHTSDLANRPLQPLG